MSELRRMYFLLVFLLLVAVFMVACTPAGTAMPSQPLARGTSANNEWKGVPVFPGATERGDTSVDVRTYVISNASILNVVDFYKEQMKATGWELLGIGNTSMKGIGEAYTLWFSKGRDLLVIEIFTKRDDVVVSLRFE